MEAREVVQVFEVVCRNLVGSQELALVGQVTLVGWETLTLLGQMVTLTLRKKQRSFVDRGNLQKRQTS